MQTDRDRFFDCAHDQVNSGNGSSGSNSAFIGDDFVGGGRVAGGRGQVARFWRAASPIGDVSDCFIMVYDCAEGRNLGFHGAHRAFRQISNRQQIRMNEWDGGDAARDC